MHTTQGQPPQYTYPGIQPHLAPVSSSVVKEGYKSSSVRRLALTQIVLGSLAFTFQLWDTINSSYWSLISTGMWTGVIFIVTGCLGLYSANQKTVCSIVSYMVMSIVSSLFALCLLVFSSMNLGYYNECLFFSEARECRYISSYMMGCTMFLSSMLIIISVIAGITGIVAASFTCHGCCYSSAIQPGPNCQLQYVSIANGQQVLVTGSPINYQTQTNAQAIQGYPVPTMAGQQQMTQPVSAYQGVSEQLAATQIPEVQQFNK